MEQMILKAVTTATDEGTFTAVISTATVDREKDVVSPAGMVRALQKWTATGKKIPLAWNHSSSPAEQIGSIDPASARQVGNEVIADGTIDQTVEAGKHVWRLVKNGTLGFSFGYLILSGTKRKGGGRNIDELDVFEVTATSTPMNNDTRVLAFKGRRRKATADQTDAETDRPPTTAQARMLNSMIGQAQEFIASDPDPEDAAEMADIIETLEELVGEPDTETDGTDGESGDGKSVTPSKRGYVTVRVPVDAAWLLPADELAAVAQRMIDTKSVDGAGRRHQTRSADPLRARADAVALDFLSDGESGRKPPAKQEVQKPAPQLALNELRQRMRDETLIALSGVDEL